MNGHRHCRCGACQEWRGRRLDDNHRAVRIALAVMAGACLAAAVTCASALVALPLSGFEAVWLGGTAVASTAVAGRIVYALHIDRRDHQSEDAA